MPRGSHGKVDEAYLGWVTADSIPVSALRHYLCTNGPRGCPTCDSKCAFGERYMAIRREENEQLEACIAAFYAANRR